MASAMEEDNSVDAVSHAMPAAAAAAADEPGSQNGASDTWAASPHAIVGLSELCTHTITEGYGGFRNSYTFHLPKRYVVKPEERDVILGHGTYGMVITAYDSLDNNRKVAIKRLTQPWGMQGEARKHGPDHKDAIRHAKLAFREIRILKFLKESWKESCIASGIEEENIYGNQQFNMASMRDCFLAETPQLVGAAKDEVPPFDIYIVQDHCGVNAGEYFIKNAENFSLPDVRDLAFQMLQALQYLHSAKVIHRDLKPANIAIREEPRDDEDDPGVDLDLGILDFGLARTVTNTDAVLYTDMDVASRNYRAPEAHFKTIGGNRDYGPAIDMWAFGVILSEMFSQCGGGEAKPMFEARASQNYCGVLSGIVEALGIPSSKYIEQLDESAQRHMHTYFGGSRTQNIRDFLRKPFSRVAFFSGQDNKSELELAIDLIDKILRYEPSERLTAEEALGHEFFADYHPGGPLDPQEWGRIKSAVTLDTSFEDLELNADGWRERILAEAEEFLEHFPPPTSE